MTTRRSTILLLVTVGLLVPTWACSSTPWDDDISLSRPGTSSEALQALKDGNQRFLGANMVSRNHLELVRETADGQSPFAIVLSCLDSRIPPELVFDQGIGDIFVGRIAGNFANADMLGSLEFGTKLVGAKLIVVLGHTRCGAISGALGHTSPDPDEGPCETVELVNLAHTLSNITLPDGRSVDGDGNVAQEVAEANVRLTVEAMTDESPVMRCLVEEGQLVIVGAMYDVATGRVTFMN